MLGLIKSIIICAILFFNVSISFASDLTMKEGQSANIATGEKIDTVFISNPAVADFKVIDDKKVVIFAKSNGISDITLYGKSSRVLKKVNIVVDGIGTELERSINKEFKDAKVKIERYMYADKLAYVIKGEVVTEELRDQIYDTVGSLVGENWKQHEVGVNSSGSGTINVQHMTRNKWSNIIDRMTVMSSPQQVNVKLTVVEVTKNFTDALGIEWSSLTLDSIIGSETKANSAGVFNLIGFKGGFDAANISTLINAVKNDSIARVLAQPNLTVLSGEVATFLVGGEIPIVVDSGGSSTTSVQYKEYGIRLNIGAKVSRKDKIRLYIANELSNVTGSYTYNSYSIPTINTRRTQSTIELADGESFVIGGLLSESDRESLTKVPFIGDIPILGALARSSQSEREKSELVVFATVKLVKPLSSNSSHELPIPKFHKTSVDKLFFNVGVSNEHKERLTSDVYGTDFLSNGGFIR